MLFDRIATIARSPRENAKAEELATTRRSHDGARWPGRSAEPCGCSSRRRRANGTRAFPGRGRAFRCLCPGLGRCFAARGGLDGGNGSGARRIVITVPGDLPNSTDDMLKLTIQPRDEHGDPIALEGKLEALKQFDLPLHVKVKRR